MRTQAWISPKAGRTLANMRAPIVGVKHKTRPIDGLKTREECDKMIEPKSLTEKELRELEAELSEEKPDPINELESMLEHEVKNAREALKAVSRE